MTGLHVRMNADTVDACSLMACVCNLHEPWGHEFQAVKPKGCLQMATNADFHICPSLVN